MEQPDSLGVLSAVERVSTLGFCHILRLASSTSVDVRPVLRLAFVAAATLDASTEHEQDSYWDR